MTASLNKVQLIGRLGVTPKLITGKENHQFATASLATHESVKQNNEWTTHTEWHQLIFFGSLIKVVEYLKKGNQVYIEGKLRTNHWTDKDGKFCQTLNIMVSSVKLLGGSHSASTEDSKSTNPALSHLEQLREMLVTNSTDAPF